jgi:hypothetical protein
MFNLSGVVWGIHMSMNSQCCGVYVSMWVYRGMHYMVLLFGDD